MAKISNGVIVHPDNPRYFLDRVTGKPLVLMGSIGPGPQDPNLDAAAIDRKITDHVQQWKANHGRLWHFTPWGLPKGQLMPWKRVAGQGKANDGHDKFDMDQWDETYWANMRAVMAAAEKHGVYIQAMVFDRCGISKGNKEDPHRWFLNPYNPVNHINNIPGLPSGYADARENNAFYNLANKELMRFQEAYVERLINEIAGFRSTIFEICNEYCDINFEPGPQDWEEHWTQFIKERCTNIVSANNLGKSTDPPGTPDRYWSNQNLDMVNWHTIWPDDAYDWFVRFYDKGKAICHGEQAYNYNENTDRPRTMSALDLRMAAWGAFLGGGHLVWDEANAMDKMDPHRATRSVMQFLEDTGFDFVHARPEPEFVDRGWCMARQGKEYVVYLQNGGSVSLDLSEATKVDVSWFRPAEGDYPERGKANGASKVTFRAPFEGDAVLYVKSVK